MMYNLQDKTIIITGANSGIGKAAAVQMDKLGGRVVMACRSLERGEKAFDFKPMIMIAMQFGLL